MFCLPVFGWQCQCNWLLGKTHLWNDLFCVECDVMPYTLTHSHVDVSINLSSVHTYNFFTVIIQSEYNNVTCLVVLRVIECVSRRQTDVWHSIHCFRCPRKHWQRTGKHRPIGILRNQSHASTNYLLQSDDNSTKLIYN